MVVPGHAWPEILYCKVTVLAPQEVAFHNKIAEVLVIDEADGGEYIGWAKTLDENANTIENANSTIFFMI